MFKNYYPLWLMLCLCTVSQAQQAPIDNIVRIAPSIPKGQDNYAPFRYGDKLYFTSNLQGNKQDMDVARIYSMEYGKAGTMLIDANPEKKGLHASNMTLTADGKMMYYALCEDVTQGKCTIWSRKKQYEGGWEAASKLPAHINLRQYTATQPGIGYDWKLKKYTLYFVSDRPGGKGGKDLWCSTIERDGSYGQPMPMPFNTEGDEVTPFFHMGEKTLFFSSNGLSGHGGFDIFSSGMNNNGEWEKPMNMGLVVNTSYDETYFSFYANVKKGYFSSNRSQSTKSREKEKNQIYEIDPVLELNIPVYNIHNMAAVHGTMAHVYDEMTGQKFVFHEEPFEPNLKVTLLPDRIYKVVVLKDGFLPSVIETSTQGVVFPVCLQQEVQLFVDEEFTHKNRETYYEPSDLPKGKEGSRKTGSSIEGKNEKEMIQQK